jgi:hypothetical protein
MVGVPGAEVQNTSPPTVALLALAVAQTGLVLLLAGPLRRWLRRRRVWAAVIAVNGVIMTLYLWHMVPVLVVALALYPTGVMPQPEIGSASWFAWRPVWVAACGLLLVVLVAVFARFERPRGRASAATPSHARAVPAAERGATRPAVVLVLIGTAATCAGIFQLTIGGFQGAGPAGVPLAALITYLVGLAAFWAARRLARTPLPAPGAGGHRDRSG